MSLNTRIKRKREVREEIINQDGLIFRLPDETLLHIFKYFKTDELVLAAGICKRFRQIAFDEEFWRTIDLTSKTYPNRVLLKFFRRFPRSCTERLKIAGIVSNMSRARRNLIRPPPFTEQLSSTVRASYPNLRHFHVARYDFRDDPSAIKNVTYLPSNLDGLYLNQCELVVGSVASAIDFLEIPRVPLKNATELFSLKQLQIVSFENSPCLGLSSIQALTKLCPYLVELNLNGCYRIRQGDELNHVLVFYHRTMRRLYLRETRIDDDTIHCICRKLKRLNILDIRQCQNVTNSIIDNLLTLKQMKTLMMDDERQVLYQQRIQQQEKNSGFE